jgi:signal transduction histidine kinase
LPRPGGGRIPAPARAVARAVNHLLYGQRDEPYAVLARLGQRLEATLAPEGVLPTIVRTVAEALRLPYVAVALSGGASGVVVGTGTPGGEPTRLPLVYQQEVVGELLLCPRTPGEAFGYADRRLLEDLARQVGVAAHAAQLTAELQHSRERLVTTREEERRRLRRDLHDGLGPVLAGLTLQLDAARTLVKQDPPAAERLLGELKTQAQTAVADIRRLVYALRPPALDDLGLVPALRATAAQYEAIDGSPLITIEAPAALPTVPAAVEVAIYRITQEALANVVRHARARSCEVRLRFDAAAGVVYLAVADDGHGGADESCPGIGLHSMRERAEELGGMFTIEAQPSGGTRVTARLPCKAELR